MYIELNHISNYSACSRSECGAGIQYTALFVGLHVKVLVCV